MINSHALYRLSYRGITGAPTPVSKDKMINYHFIKAKSTKQGVLGVRMTNDAERLCDLTLEPWTLAYAKRILPIRRWYNKSAQQAQINKNNRPEWQIQSQLRNMLAFSI